MNLSNLFVSLFRILDAKYPKQFCKGLGKYGNKEKQCIPGIREASIYARTADRFYYRDYLNHKNEHPHITGAYYCPWCDAWHLTTQPGGASASADLLESQIEKASQAGEPLSHLPKNGHLRYVDFNFPDYPKELIDKLP